MLGQTLFYALLLLLPLSALAARRLPMATVMRYAIAWIVIFAIGFILVRAVC